MFEPPPTPEKENDTTFVIIPENATIQDIEEVVRGVNGRVNIMGNVMYRNMPECMSKAGLSITWGRLYGDFEIKSNIFSAGGTAGTRYASKNFLSPGLSAWNLKQQNRRQNTGVVEHLMQPGAAPNWIMDFEWQSEVNKPRRGTRKVLDYYFNEVGTNDSRVDEAWIMVKHQDVPVPDVPPPPSYVLRIMRWFSYLPFIGVFVYVLLRVLDIVTGTQGWTGRTRRRSTPPADPAVPYIIVYFRQHAERRYGYYWLQWHETFTAPAPSLYHAAPPVFVNAFLQMMRGQA